MCGWFHVPSFVRALLDPDEAAVAGDGEPLDGPPGGRDGGGGDGGGGEVARMR